MREDLGAKLSQGWDQPLRDWDRRRWLVPYYVILVAIVIYPIVLDSLLESEARVSFVDTLFFATACCMYAACMILVLTLLALAYSIKRL